MKNIFLTFLALFIALTTFCQTSEKLNFDFELVDNGKPKDWNNSGSSNYAIALDSINTRNGKYSATIEYKDGNPGFKAWAFTIPDNYEGKKITLTGYIKTENVTDGYAGLWMRIDPSIALDNMNKNGVKGTTDWTKYEITLKLNPEKTKQIVIGGLLVGKGKMWLDNLSVSIDGEDIKDLEPFERKFYPAVKDKEFDKMLHWISMNSIEIENAHPDSQLVVFQKRTPKKFSEAQIFGFGEATHQTKEFFNIKAKFFKYLVENQGVKAFLMEDSYTAEAGINEWISGGNGDIKTIAQNFSIGSWYCKEIVNLLQWMRNYNMGKPKEEQIRFFGVDIQNVEGINKDIRQFVERHNIQIKEELLLAVDSSANKQFMFQSPEPTWAATHIAKLKEVEKIFLDAKSTSKPHFFEEYHITLRALNSLTYYLQHVVNPKNFTRDMGMYENTKCIIEKELNNGKAFLWAHNGHVNNKELPPFGTNWTSLGGYMKGYFKDKYYSVGFDFGTGYVTTYNSRKKKMELKEIKKPFRKTYAEKLNELNSPIFFIDMNEVLQTESASFFMTKKRQLYLGGAGYVKGRSIIDIIYSESYDAIIFVKEVSIADYTL